LKGYHLEIGSTRHKIAAPGKYVAVGVNDVMSTNDNVKGDYMDSDLSIFAARVSVVVVDPPGTTIVDHVTNTTSFPLENGVCVTIHRALGARPCIHGAKQWPGNTEICMPMEFLHDDGKPGPDSILHANVTKEVEMGIPYVATELSVLKGQRYK
jgi:hypothetical protein